MISTSSVATIERMAVVAFTIGIVGAYQGLSKFVAELSPIVLVVAVVAYIFSQIVTQTQWLQLLERSLVLLMIVGLVGMFQPWNIIYYEYGFYVLIASTFSFIIVSHIPVQE